MDIVKNLVDKITKPSFSYEFGNIAFEPSYLQAGLIVLLLFLLVLTIARVRYLYVHWNLGKSAISMLVWGFLLAVIVEGFLLIGGRTIFTQILGWENAPKPISTVLDISRNKLVDVLGESDSKVDINSKETYSAEFINGLVNKLSGSEKEKLEGLICKP